MIRFRPNLISKLVDMSWPSDAIVPLSAALIEMVETEVECELALKKVKQSKINQIEVSKNELV